MRVAFGVSVLARGLHEGGVDGIGVYTRELMAAMPASAQLQPYLFGAPASLWRGDGPAVNAGAFGPQALAALLFRREFGDARRALGGRVDVWHATDHMVPRLRGTPVVATVFDAIPLSHPQWMGYRAKALKNELWRRTVFWAQHVVTISEFSRQQIAMHFRLPEERITAIPLGVGPQWFAALDASVAAAVEARHALPPRYFLSVGTLQPRKNIGRVLAAHAALPERLQQECPLLIVGKPGWGCDEEVSLLTSGRSRHVRWLRHLPDAELQVVAKRATALVFPSLLEGFGLPVLEAFAARVPVVSSNTSSIPEVAGEAALLVDPLRVDEIAGAMQRIAECADLARDLVARGQARVRGFSWQRCAERTLDVYRSLV